MNIPKYLKPFGVELKQQEESIFMSCVRKQL